MESWLELRSRWEGGGGGERESVVCCEGGGGAVRKGVQHAVEYLSVFSALINHVVFSFFFLTHSFSFPALLRYKQYKPNTNTLKIDFAQTYCILYSMFV
jgi:hypothetical protein